MLNPTTLRIKAAYDPSRGSTIARNRQAKMTVEQMTEQLKREMARKEKKK